jgi:hypothetical protein
VHQCLERAADMGGASAAGEGDASAAGLCRSRVAASGEVGIGGDIGGRLGA